MAKPNEYFEERILDAGYDPNLEPLDNIARALFALVAAVEDQGASSTHLETIGEELSGIALMLDKRLPHVVKPKVSKGAADGAKKRL